MSYDLLRLSLCSEICAKSKRISLFSTIESHSTNYPCSFYYSTQRRYREGIGIVRTRSDDGRNRDETKTTKIEKNFIILHDRVTRNKLPCSFYYSTQQRIYRFCADTDVSRRNRGARMTQNRDPKPRGALTPSTVSTYR